MKHVLFIAIIALFSSCTVNQRISQNIRRHKPAKQVTIDPSSETLQVRYQSFGAFLPFLDSRSAFFKMIGGCNCQQPSDTTLLVLQEKATYPQFALLAQADNGTWHLVAHTTEPATGRTFLNAIRTHDNVVSISGIVPAEYRWTRKNYGWRWR